MTVQIEAAPDWLSQGLHHQPRLPPSSLEGLLATLLSLPACAPAPGLARSGQWSVVSGHACYEYVSRRTLVLAAATCYCHVMHDHWLQ